MLFFNKFRKVILVSEVVKVTDIIGVREHKTLKGQTLFPVFYEAVEEYHNVLAAGDFNTMFNFLTSEETANKVATNIRNLAMKLNNGVLPDNLDVLPLSLYETFTKEQHQVILTVTVPLEGSKKRQNYDSGFLSLRKTISKTLAHAYHLPINSNKQTKLIEKMLEFSGQSSQTAVKSVKNILGLRLMNVYLIYIASFGTFVTTALALQQPAIVFVASLIGFLGLVPATIMGPSVNDSVSLKKNKTVSFSWGACKKLLQSTVSEYGTLIKPSLASMEGLLLQESSLVDDLIIVQENKTGIQNSR